jgi:ParE toxin of type II toxin-antitoxin system, parDE
MPAEIVWLDQALDDLDSILDYISNDSPKAALRYGADLEKAVRDWAIFQCRAAPSKIATAAWFSETTLSSIGMTQRQTLCLLPWSLMRGGIWTGFSGSEEYPPCYVFPTFVGVTSGIFWHL